MWAWRLIQTFLKPHVLDKRPCDDAIANVFVYNSGSNHLIFILIIALESAGLSPSPVRKALKSDKNCWRDDLYKLALEKTGEQIVMVTDPPPPPGQQFSWWWWKFTLQRLGGLPAELSSNFYFAVCHPDSKRVNIILKCLST